MSSEMIKTFRYLHSIPETEWDEIETSKYIEDFLKNIGLTPVRCTKTGLYADICGKNSDKAILLRADIDALPILEESGVPYASENVGRMHACGHDFHTTSLLYAAKKLYENKDKLSGTVRVLFQPAEEGSGGAEYMIDSGALEGMTAAFAIHSDPTENVGTVSYKDGGITASPDDYKLIITGKGGHGAEPEKCINPLTVASEIILEYNNLKNKYFKNEECVITVCTMHGGTLNNIIPDEVEITGTARMFSEDLRQDIKSKLKEIAENICKNHNAKLDFTYNELFPPTVNNPDMNRIVKEAVKVTKGIDKIIKLENGLYIGDDFSYFARLVPSTYLRFGTSEDDNKYPLHSSKFKIDERAIPIAADLFYNVAIKYLNS